MNIKSIKFWVLVLVVAGVAVFFVPFPVRHAPQGKVLIIGQSGGASYQVGREIEFTPGMTVKDAKELWIKTPAYNRGGAYHEAYFFSLEPRMRSGWDRLKPWVAMKMENLLSKQWPDRSSWPWKLVPSVGFGNAVGEDAVLQDGDALDVSVIVLTN
jgi:hypothetical protein